MAVSNIGVRGVIGGSECGILLDNDVVLLAQTINSLIENENKRKIMSNAAVGYSKIYDIHNIIDMWLSLFYDKLKEKDNSFNKSTPDSNL